MKIESTFECLGYFEEVFDTKRNKLLGVRDVEKPDRPLGSPGMIDAVITAPITLRKGAGDVKTYRATPASPIHASLTLQMKCGRVLNRTALRAMLGGEIARIEGKLAPR
jgi:hypothetical protein